MTSADVTDTVGGQYDVVVVGAGNAALTAALAAQEQHNHSEAREQFRVEPQRIEKGPVVDGILDEETWKTATASTPRPS